MFDLQAISAPTPRDLEQLRYIEEMHGAIRKEMIEHGQLVEAEA